MSKFCGLCRVLQVHHGAPGTPKLRAGGVEGRRFESCRPDQLTLIPEQSRRNPNKKDTCSMCLRRMIPKLCQPLCPELCLVWPKVDQ
jgi:hypothetical protein